MPGRFRLARQKPKVKQMIEVSLVTDGNPLCTTNHYSFIAYAIVQITIHDEFTHQNTSFWLCQTCAINLSGMLKAQVELNLA